MREERKKKGDRKNNCEEHGIKDDKGNEVEIKTNKEKEINKRKARQGRKWQKNENIIKKKRRKKKDTEKDEKGLWKKESRTRKRNSAGGRIEKEKEIEE